MKNTAYDIFTIRTWWTKTTKPFTDDEVQAWADRHGSAVHISNWDPLLLSKLPAAATGHALGHSSAPAIGTWISGIDPAYGKFTFDDVSLPAAQPTVDTTGLRKRVRDLVEELVPAWKYHVNIEDQPSSGGWAIELSGFKDLNQNVCGTIDGMVVHAGRHSKDGARALAGICIDTFKKYGAKAQ